MHQRAGAPKQPLRRKNPPLCSLGLCGSFCDFSRASCRFWRRLRPAGFCAVGHWYPACWRTGEAGHSPVREHRRSLAEREGLVRFTQTCSPNGRGRPFAHIPPLESLRASLSLRESAIFALRKWRRGRDSNPREPCDPSGFQDRRNRPLCHLSVSGILHSRQLFRAADRVQANHVGCSPRSGR